MENEVTRPRNPLRYHPRPLGNLQRLQWSCRTLMLVFHFLINSARSHILSNIHFHSLPLETLFQILIHPGLTKMNSIRGTMSLSQDVIFDLPLLWYTKVAFEPQYTGLINAEISHFLPSSRRFLTCCTVDHSVALPTHTQERLTQESTASQSELRQQSN